MYINACSTLLEQKCGSRKLRFWLEITMPSSRCFTRRKPTPANPVHKMLFWYAARANPYNKAA